MPVARRRLEQALSAKLGMRLDVSRDHRYYELYVDGEWVLQTKVSTGTGHQEIGDPIVAKIAKEMNVTRRQLNDLVQCPMSYADYVAHLRRLGRL